jgi:hypothetical protein
MDLKEIKEYRDNGKLRLHFFRDKNYMIQNMYKYFDINGNICHIGFTVDGFYIGVFKNFCGNYKIMTAKNKLINGVTISIDFNE